MFPVLIKIGPFTLHTYGFLIAIGFLVALGIAVMRAKRAGLSPEKITDIGFYSLLAAIVGSRLFFVGQNWSFFSSRPLEIVKIWEGGLVFYGGVLLAVPTALWYTRKQGLPLWKTADVWAPSIAIGHAIGRLGCFCAGCCYGKPADSLSWAVTFTHPETLAIRGVPLHPAQLYESGAEFLNFLVLIFLGRRASFDGRLFWVYILNYSIIRSVVEVFRGDEVRGFLLPGVSTSQGISVIMFLGAAIMLLRLRKQGERG
ncbi:MAG: prolipoprotein diacylglyceryl transferase [Nitrospiraceae bacterium]|nr:prolipoprotein diacylglyceryl transferase [Nitrospiraceae bacterium]